MDRSDSEVAIVGAGPVGLETAAMLAAHGFRVTLFDKGRVGNAVRGWGHVRLFTPFHMNRSESTRQLLGDSAPDDDVLLTGRQFVAQWLTPLAAALRETVNIREHHQVVSVGRDTLRKSDRPGQSTRADFRFQLLVEDTTEGTGRRESIHLADILIDCTGFISSHRWIGAGGMACPGERQRLCEADYTIPDVTGVDRERFANRRTLVVGSGASAATAIAALAKLQHSAKKTAVTWITNAGSPTPLTVIQNDPLPARYALFDSVNTLVCDNDGPVNWLPGAQIDEIQGSRDQGYFILVHEPTTNGAVTIEADSVVALPGYRPDTTPFDELQIHRCYATDGPIRLAAHLLGEGAGDCMAQSAVGADLLRNPEPNFYILGAASYGRNSSFLLRTGIEQARNVVDDLVQHRGRS